MTDQVAELALGRGLIELAAAAFLASLGLASIALFLLRRRSADLTLSYGGFALLYAVRLASGNDLVQLALGGSDRFWEALDAGLTYAILPLATWFSRGLLGAGWRRSLHWLHRAACVFAPIALAGLLVSSSSVWLMRVNNILVLAMLGAIGMTLGRIKSEGVGSMRVVRAGTAVVIVLAVAENLRSMGMLPWPMRIEFIGMTTFLMSLASAVADRFLQAEGRLAAVERELATARRIQERILPDRVPNTRRFRISARYVPMTEVAGDFYAFPNAGDGRAAVLVADVSGHGVPAALIASMVKIATASHRDDAGDPGALLTSLSQSLDGQLGGQFVTAVCLSLHDATAEVAWSIAGHPPPLRWSAGEQRLSSLDGGGILIGLMSAAYSSQRLRVSPGDRVIVYTDGVLEVTNAAGEFFGDSRFHAVIEEHAARASADLADAIIAEMRAWRGKLHGFDDDVTLVVVEVL
jgi:sigma-B regulation protein RsbU (phosphoserine phosphatase)